MGAVAELEGEAMRPFSIAFRFEGDLPSAAFGTVACTDKLPAPTSPARKGDLIPSARRRLAQSMARQD